MRLWSYLKLTVGQVALAALLIGGSAAAETSDRFTPAPPEPGTDIPAATVKFGMRPYADNTFYVIGMKKGWFQDVGINFDPAPYGLKANDTNVTALLLNGQLDIICEYCPLMLPTYKDANKLKCIAFTDNFLANAILANPELKLKTFRDYIGEGKGFDDALKAALAPMKGKTLVGRRSSATGPSKNTSTRHADAGFKLQVLDDAKSLVLAKSGREDFLNPEGAPIVYTLLQAGWTNLVDIDDLIKHGPGGVESPIEPLIGIVGIGGNSDYINSHPEHGAALPFGRLAGHRRDQEGRVALRSPGALSELDRRHQPRRQGRRGHGRDPASVHNLRRQQAILRRQGKHDLLRQRLDARSSRTSKSTASFPPANYGRRHHLGRADLEADGGLSAEDGRDPEEARGSNSRRQTSRNLSIRRRPF